MESFGEDPFLNGVMGTAMLRGYQGEEGKRPGREQKNTGVRYRRLFKAFCRLWCSECGKRIQ